MTPSCQCGGPFAVQFPYGGTGISRIINGFEVPAHSLPFQVLVVTVSASGQQGYCGGTLLSPNYVLTAVHCFTASTVRSFVLVGAHSYSGSGQTVDVADLLIHPQWSLASPQYDYAILKLATSLTVAPTNPDIGLACLSFNADQNLTDVRLTTSGWGSTSAGSSNLSPVLKAAFLRSLSSTNCAAVFGAPAASAGFLPGNLLCSVPELNSTTCTGDDGGKILRRYRGTPG